MSRPPSFLYLTSDVMLFWVRFAVYDTRKGMRIAKRARSRVLRDRDGLTDIAVGRFRPPENANGGAILFSGTMRGSDEVYSLSEIFLHRDQPLVDLVDDLAHECAHVANGFVEDEVGGEHLRLLARDSKKKRSLKLSEAIATITGTLTATAFAWIQCDCDWEKYKDQVYEDILFPADLWRLKRKEA